MSFIRPNAPSIVWKTFGATPRAWNGTRPSHARELTCSGGRVGSKFPWDTQAARLPLRISPSACYGELFGLADAAAAGDGARDSPAFSLINSRSNMGVAF